MGQGDQDQVFVNVAKSIQRVHGKTPQARVVHLGDPAKFDLDEVDDFLKASRDVSGPLYPSPESSTAIDQPSFENEWMR